MKKFLYILTACLLFLLLCSDSCNSNRQDSSAAHEAELTREVENLKNEFKSDELTEKSLGAFVVKAKQKLVDLSDYLSIYSVKTTDESFKAQAHQMILNIFISENVRINDLLMNELGRKVILLCDILNQKPEYISMNLKFDSILIGKPLQRSDGMNYTGSLKFSRFLNVGTSSGTLISEPAKMEVEIIVSKVKKVFGNDTLKVWNVSLGNIQ